MKKLPEDFILWRRPQGRISSERARQRKGGKGPVAGMNSWRKQGRFLADPASDFYHKYPETFGSCESSHVRCQRCAPFHRLEPDLSGKAPGRINP